jgi:hypothetical protein
MTTELVAWSLLEFEKIPIKYTPKDALSMWLAVRGIREELKSRNEAIELVQNIIDQGNVMLPDLRV